MRGGDGESIVLIRSFGDEGGKQKEGLMKD